MTTIFHDQSAALDQHLNTMAALPPVAWEGRPFLPTLDVLYLHPSNEPSDTVARTQRDHTHGAYTVDVLAPAGEGKNEAVAMADKISNWFAHGTELTYNGVTVVVENVHRDDGRMTAKGGGRYKISVIIDYYSFTLRR